MSRIIVKVATVREKTEKMTQFLKIREMSGNFAKGLGKFIVKVLIKIIKKVRELYFQIATWIFDMIISFG